MPTLGLNEDEAGAVVKVQAAVRGLQTRDVQQESRRRKWMVYHSQGEYERALHLVAHADEIVAIEAARAMQHASATQGSKRKAVESRVAPPDLIWEGWKLTLSARAWLPGGGAISDAANKIAVGWRVHRGRRARQLLRAAQQIQRAWRRLILKLDAVDELERRRRVRQLLVLFARSETRAATRIQRRFREVRASLLDCDVRLCTLHIPGHVPHNLPTPSLRRSLL
jgi:hypothetical protein